MSHLTTMSISLHAIYAGAKGITLGAAIGELIRKRSRRHGPYPIFALSQRSALFSSHRQGNSLRRWSKRLRVNSTRARYLLDLNA